MYCKIPNLTYIFALYLKKAIMKRLLIVGLLMTGISGQALSMGHPHNMFAARKQLRTKTSISIAKARPAICFDFHNKVQLAKTTFSERLVAALTQLH